MRVGAIKASIPKNWWKKDGNASIGRNKKTLTIDSIKVKSKSDLPELLTTKEVAALLKKHIKTIEQWRNEGRIQFFKIMGRYFTTPGLVAEFIETEFKKYG